MTQGQISEPKAALTYILGGKSFVTLVSLKSGNRYTYKVELADRRNPNDPDTWFVALLMGPDNWANYKYIGMVKDGHFQWTGKSKVGKDAPSFVGFDFVFNSLQAGCMNGFEVWHEGRCGRCGKKLTVPESVASGFGPDCAEMVGVASAAMPSVVSAGAVAPQYNLNFDGSARQPKAKPVKAHGVAVMNDSPQSDKKFLAAFGSARQPKAKPVKAHGVAVMNDSPQSDKKFLAAFTQNVGDLDAMIRARILTYKAEAPENFYQDGELDEKQAFNVAYNMFRVKIGREGK